ncbi:hypothetical protein LJC24_03910 [Desulfococcaceae bacterium OttesenSCG-928-F15]|nr:hypothetical protein [Desulfococcaceae bacterium OttesenSCG-928-F15]
MKESVHASPEQTAYADLLFYGCWLGLVIMVVTYSLYVFGVITPHVPLEKMPEVWTQPVSHYLKEAQVPTGWGWATLLKEGDFLNFIGIVLLAGLSIVCYLRIIPSLFRKGDRAMAIIATLEVFVLVLAASGIFGSGAH